MSFEKYLKKFELKYLLVKTEKIIYEFIDLPNRKCLFNVDQKRRRRYIP